MNSRQQSVISMRAFLSRPTAGRRKLLNDLSCRLKIENKKTGQKWLELIVQFISLFRVRRRKESFFA